MKRLSWTELALLPAALAALTTCWVALWVRWLMAAGGLTGAPAVAPWVMLVTLVLGAFVTRWAVASVQNNLELQRPRRIIGLAGLGAVTGLLWVTFGWRFPVGYLRNFTEWGRLVSPEALALGVGVLLWWQAIRIGRDDDLHSSARRELGLGVAALAVLFVFNKINPRLDTAEAFWPTVLFFIIGLGALAVAGFEQDRRIQSGGGAPALGLNRSWLGTVGAIIGVIVAGAIAVAGLVSPDTFTALDGLLNIVGVIILDGLGLLVYLAAVVLLPLGEALARALLPLLRLLTGLSASFNFHFNAPTPEQIDAAARQLARTPPFRLLEVAVVIGLALLVFMGAVRRLRLLGGGEDADEVHESILSRDLLWKQLRSLFARGPAAASHLPDFVPLDGPDGDPRLAVRRAYQQVLEWAAAAGRPRLPRQTPRAFAQTLAADGPAESAAIDLLTETYIRARYDGPISAGDARQAETAARQIMRSAG